MAQAVVIESPESLEVKAYLQEAEAQLASIERSYSYLVVVLGTADAEEARAQAKVAVETYQRQYNQIVGVSR